MSCLNQMQMQFLQIFIVNQGKAINASSDDDSSSEEGADEVDNDSIDSSLSRSDKMSKGKSLDKDSDSSKDRDSSHRKAPSSTDTDDDTCENLDDKESLEEPILLKHDSSMDDIDDKDFTMNGSNLTNENLSTQNQGWGHRRPRRGQNVIVVF